MFFLEYFPSPRYVKYSFLLLFERSAIVCLLVQFHVSNKDGLILVKILVIVLEYVLVILIVNDIEPLCISAGSAYCLDKNRGFRALWNNC